MKLIRELQQEVEFLTEAREDGGKNYYIHGIFLQAERPNGNGRFYPYPVMESAVRDYIERKVNTNRAYGELGHPSGPGINLDRVSHMVTELKHDGNNNFVGKARIANTPMGNIVRGLHEMGANTGVSSRGMGSLRENKQGLMEVQNDFKLATAADIVADPSAPDAFVRGIMENVDWVYDPIKDTWLEEKLHSTRRSLKKMSMSEMESRALGIFESYVNSLGASTVIV